MNDEIPEWERRQRYFAYGFSDPRYGPSLAERTRRRQPITREWVADMLDDLVASGVEPEPMRIQYEHQRTAAEQAKIDQAIDYIDSLTGGHTHHRSRHLGRIEER
jgi:hypothetical protein